MPARRLLRDARRGGISSSEPPASSSTRTTFAQWERQRRLRSSRGRGVSERGCHRSATMRHGSPRHSGADRLAGRALRARKRIALVSLARPRPPARTRRRSKSRSRPPGRARLFDRVRQNRRVTKRRDHDRDVGQVAPATASAGRRAPQRSPHPRRHSLRRQGPPRTCSTNLTLSCARRGRFFTRRFDASLLALVGARLNTARMLVPRAGEHGDTLGAVQLDAPLAHRRHGRDLERVPRLVGRRGAR